MSPRPSGSAFPGDGLRKLALPALVFLLLEVLAALLPGSGLLMGLALSLLLCAAFACFAVTWLRLLLRGPGAVPGKGLTLSLREAHMFGWIAVLVLLASATSQAAMIVLAVPLAALGGEIEPDSGLALLLQVLAILPALALLARLSLVLPAVAVDEAKDLAAMWQATAACWQRVLLMAVLPAALLDWIAGALVGGGSAGDAEGAGARVAAALGYGAVTLLVGAVGLYLLAREYRQLAGAPARPRRQVRKGS